MPMTLRLDAQKWFCGTCKEFTEPNEPPRIEPRKSDPSRPKWPWLRIAIIMTIVFLLIVLRDYLI
jgi:hypothetical protein